jgi:cell division protein FtsB
VRAPSSESNEGLLLSTLTLVRNGQAQRAAADPAKRDLLAKKEALEQKIDKLKYEKAAMPEDEYRNQLTGALVELAHIQQELDK